MAEKKKSKPSQNNELKSEEWMPFYEELLKESPRGSVLVGAAFLDEHLRQLLEAFMIDKKTIVKDLLEGANAPLSSFSARIKTSYCLGLISSEEYHDLNIIREIRNEFAHALQGLTFENEWIVEQCSKLIIPKKLGPKSERLSPSSQFSITVAILSPWIDDRKLSAKREKREVKPDFGTDHLQIYT